MLSWRRHHTGYEHTTPYYHGHCCCLLVSRPMSSSAHDGSAILSLFAWLRHVCHRLAVTRLASIGYHVNIITLTYTYYIGCRFGGLSRQSLTRRQSRVTLFAIIGYITHHVMVANMNMAATTPLSRRQYTTIIMRLRHRSLAVTGVAGCRAGGGCWGIVTLWTRLVKNTLRASPSGCHATRGR